MSVEYIVLFDGFLQDNRPAGPAAKESFLSFNADPASQIQPDPRHPYQFFLMFAQKYIALHVHGNLEKMLKRTHSVTSDVSPEKMPFGRMVRLLKSRSLDHAN